MSKRLMALMLAWMMAMAILAGCGTFKGVLNDTGWLLRSAADNITLEQDK